MTTQTPEKRQELVDELREIQVQMLECLEQAKTLIEQSGQEMTLQRAEAYWLAHARIALTNDHGLPGRLDVLDGRHHRGNRRGHRGRGRRGLIEIGSPAKCLASCSNSAFIPSPSTTSPPGHDHDPDRQHLTP
jgi:hypothetical protein